MEKVYLWTIDKSENTTSTHKEITASKQTEKLIQEVINSLNMCLSRQNTWELLGMIHFGDVKVSIQASRFHYCTPRTDNAETYTKLELWFPSKKPPEYIMPYEEPINEDPTENIYGYVPINLIAKWIIEKGGKEILLIK